MASSNSGLGHARLTNDTSGEYRTSRRFMHGSTLESVLGLGAGAATAAAEDAEDDAGYYDGDDEGEDDLAGVIDRQASHGSMVANIVYTVEWDTGERFALELYDKVVYVMGTGAGKSVAFALPAYLQPESINVVMQPTKALQTTTYERLANLGHAARHEINWVIVDEAQKVLGARSTWRKKLLGIRSLVDPISPWQVYITGTLPPSLEDEFRRRLAFSPDDRPVMLRSKTTRDSLRYQYIDREIDLAGDVAFLRKKMKLARRRSLLCKEESAY
ncbi:hypothetical protein DL764_009360 [Monosporascus ibericus]|uniref:DEAD/DEAH-box helicase domain-containing protein n=1 Tax=Monosporascus ibericus TaxID=155417 RepID=A0A4Q4SV87_9PEZI|nr:hypothetical protein DL764_009360 [Monosporascus ibericus]